MRSRTAVVVAVVVIALAAVAGWATSMDVGSDALTSMSVDQTVQLPTSTTTGTLPPTATPTTPTPTAVTPPTPTPTLPPTPTPTPIPSSTLYLRGEGSHGQLLVTPPTSQNAVSIGSGATRYAISSPGTVTSASNASAWSLTLVSRGILGSQSTSLSIAIYWQDGSSTCAPPVRGQIFAQVTNYPLLGRPNLQGYTINVPAVAGTVSRTFDSNDRLCLRIANSGLLNMGYRTGINSTSGVSGMSRITRPLSTP